MADLALEGVHRIKLLSDAGGAQTCDCFHRDILQFGLAVGAEASNVEHQARTFTGFGLNCQTGQFLKCVEDLAVFTDQALKSTGLFGDDLDACAIILNVDLNVAIEVGDIQQLFQVVGCEFALFFEALNRGLGLLTHVVLP